MSNVKEVTKRLQEITRINPDLQDVWTRGRISNVVSTRNGTLNFTITDEGEKIECVIFKDGVSLQEKLPVVGNNVFVKGQIYVYDAKSEYRFVVTDINLSGDFFPPQLFSIRDLTKTLRATLRNHPVVEVQGEITKAFKTSAGFTVLKLKDITMDDQTNEVKDVTMDDQTNEVIECILPPNIDSPFSLQQGEAITVEGKFDIFTAASTYSIVIEDPKGLKKLVALGKGGQCEECGQPCRQSHLLCRMCYFAQFHHEGIVVGAVLRYFKAPKFVNFSTEREYSVNFGATVGRADVVLLNNKERPAAIAECKRIGDGGPGGIEQLESYLNATRTNLGLFADDTDPGEWTFLKRNGEENEYDKITRSQFERELGVEPALEVPPAQTRLEIIQGNIVEAKVDAIVNAAKAELTRGGGVDGAIRDAGGEEIDKACQKIIESEGVCPSGEAVITTGGKLPAAYVIHTVGPIWQGGGYQEAAALTRCYKNSLQLAVENGIRSIAFPAISTGNYLYPIEEATSIALKTVKDFVEQARQNNEIVPERIQFVLFDEKTYNCYLNAISELGLSLFCL